MDFISLRGKSTVHLGQEEVQDTLCIFWFVNYDELPGYMGVVSK